MLSKSQKKDNPLSVFPLVSVIIPCYNRSAIVSRAISSVLDQTYSCLEIIIVDDGSEDVEELVRVIDEFDDERLRLVKHPENRYQPAASNTGIKAANGELIAFLDSDDEWLPQKLTRQVELWHSLSQERALIYTQSDVRTKPNQFSGEKIWPQRPIAEDESVGDYLFLNRGFLQTSSILLPQLVALEVQFDETIQKHTDYNFLLRLEAAGVSFAMVEEPLVIVHWENLHSTTRGQSTEKSIAFLSIYKKYLTPKALTAFYLRQIIYRQLRSGKWRVAWRLFRENIILKHLGLLDYVNLVSIILFRDERAAKLLAKSKKLLQL
jgi:glycosyltransferase involved in cell wall biosynthesis